MALPSPQMQAADARRAQREPAAAPRIRPSPLPLAPTGFAASGGTTLTLPLGSFPYCTGCAHTSCIPEMRSCTGGVGPEEAPTQNNRTT